MYYHIETAASITRASRDLEKAIENHWPRTLINKRAARLLFLVEDARANRIWDNEFWMDMDEANAVGYEYKWPFQRAAS